MRPKHQVPQVRSRVLREIMEEIQQEKDRRVAFPHWSNWRNWKNWKNWTNWANWWT